MHKKDSQVDTGFLEEGLKSIKKGFVFNSLPDFFINFLMKYFGPREWFIGGYRIFSSPEPKAHKVSL